MSPVAPHRAALVAALVRRDALRAHARPCVVCATRRETRRRLLVALAIGLVTFVACSIGVSTIFAWMFSGFPSIGAG